MKNSGRILGKKLIFKDYYWYTAWRFRKVCQPLDSHCEIHKEVILQFVAYKTLHTSQSKQRVHSIGGHSFWNVGLSGRIWVILLEKDSCPTDTLNGIHSDDFGTVIEIIRDTWIIQRRYDDGELRPPGRLSRADAMNKRIQKQTSIPQTNTQCLTLWPMPHAHSIQDSWIKRIQPLYQEWKFGWKSFSSFTEHKLLRLIHFRTSTDELSLTGRKLQKYGTWTVSIGHCNLKSGFSRDQRRWFSNES
jgi:hypothetical protein